METQTIEQFLLEQLNVVAPGKYVLANVLQLFKSKLRFPCTHLKGGRRTHANSKDYNLSVFTYSTGVIEIKCLYNCGLKISSTDTVLANAFAELRDIANRESTNSQASAEVRLVMKNGARVPIDPGPAPVYTDAYRQRIKDSNDAILAMLERKLSQGVIAECYPMLGGHFPHPDPIEAPDSQVERNMLAAHKKLKERNESFRKSVQATVVVQDSFPALEPVKKIHKTRKTQSRKRGK